MFQNYKTLISCQENIISSSIRLKGRCFCLPFQQIKFVISASPINLGPKHGVALFISFCFLVKSRCLLCKCTKPLFVSLQDHFSHFTLTISFLLFKNSCPWLLSHYVKLLMHLAHDIWSLKDFEFFSRNNCLTSHLNLAYFSIPYMPYSQPMQHMDTKICYWLESFGKYSVIVYDSDNTRF